MSRRLASLLVFASVALLTACGASPRRFGLDFGGGTQSNNAYYGPRPNNVQAVPQAGAATVTASGDARNQLAQLDRLLRQRGFAPLGPAVHGNLPPSGLIAYAVNTAPGACYAVFALGEQPGQDLDLTITDASMQTVAYDVRPDAHPWAFTCASTGGRLAARLQMQGTGGGYYYAVYQASGGTQLDLASFFGGAAAAPQVQTAQLDATTNARIEAAERALTGERFSRIYGPSGIVLGAGQVREFPATLQAGTCYAFATFGGPGATDTDVSLLDGSGSEVARDVASNVDGMFRVCPTTSGSYRLQVKMYGGSGPLFTTAYQQGAAPAANTQVVAATSTAGAGLEDNFRLLDGDMHARGYENFGDAQRSQLSESAETDYPMSLEGGKCYAILAVGDNGVRDLDLRLLNARGDVVDRDVEQNARPIVRVCPTASGSYTMRVKMFAGAGNFVYQQYRWPRGTRGPFGLSGLMYVRLAEVTQLLNVEGFEPDTDFTPERANLRREGDERTHDIPMRGGRCYSVLAVGGDGIVDLDASLLQGTTPIATEASTNAFPSVRHCPAQNGTFKLKVRAASGSGAYFFQLFTQSQ
jgi:hypothetical protein